MKVFWVRLRKCSPAIQPWPNYSYFMANWTAANEREFMANAEFDGKPSRLLATQIPSRKIHAQNACLKVVDRINQRGTRCHSFPSGSCNHALMDARYFCFVGFISHWRCRRPAHTHWPC